MKRQYLILAILALLLPATLRGLSFYRGIPSARPEIATPDYASFTRPEVEVNTPAMDDVEQVGGTVLLDGYHGNQFFPAEIDSFTAAIRARGGTVEMVTDAFMLETQLKSASAFVSISPSYGFSEIEVNLLKNFTDRGGKILLFADATRYFIYYDSISGNPITFGDASAANSLLRQYDITIHNDYLYNTEKNEGNFRNVLFDEFGKSELTFGLDEVAFYGAHSVESLSGTILLQGAETNLSSTNDAHNPNAGGAVLSADETTAAFGDFTFMSTPYNTYTDNAALIQNIADFALSGTQTPNLELFPYIFTGNTVQVVVSPDLEKNTGMVSALGALQSSMRNLNLKLVFEDELPSSGDFIVFGSFDAAEEFNSALQKADVEIDGGTIRTVAFGDVNRGGNGIILFQQGRSGNALILLADNSDDIIALMSMIGSGDLSSCLRSELVAICSVGYDDFYYDDTFDEPAIEEDAEPALEATPTPGG